MEEENQIPKQPKQDFSAVPKKVYSQNFTLEKESIKPEKKQYKTTVFSWIISFVILIITAGIGAGYYIYTLPPKLIPEKLSLFATNPPSKTLNNSTIEKKNRVEKIVTKKFDQPVLSKALGIYELSTGNAVFEQNATAKLPMASITKLLTVITMQSLYTPSSTFTINAIGGNIAGSRAEVTVGEKISYEDTLYGLMLPSGNDIAVSVAMQYGYDDFVENMNQIKSTLGLDNTNITNPVGFDENNNNYSTIQDLFKICRLYLQKELNRKVADTYLYDIKGLAFNKTYKIKNTNDLLPLLPEINGLKTGTSDAAGQSLVLYIKIDTREYIAILLNSSDRFKEGQKIVEWLRVNG